MHAVFRRQLHPSAPRVCRGIRPQGQRRGGDPVGGRQRLPLLSARVRPSPPTCRRSMRGLGGGFRLELGPKGSRKNETGGRGGSAKRVLPARRGSKNARRLLRTLEGYSACAGTRIWLSWERGEEIHIEEAASRPVASRRASAAADFGGATLVLTRWRRCPVAGMCRGCGLADSGWRKSLRVPISSI